MQMWRLYPGRHPAGLAESGAWLCAAVWGLPLFSCVLLGVTFLDLQLPIWKS